MGNGIPLITTIYYDCPGCGDRVWAQSGFEGQNCWSCKTKPFTKVWYDCPTCDDRVWVYRCFAANFKGHSCIGCSGTTGLSKYIGN